jgi:type IV secretion system protein VirD4
VQKTTHGSADFIYGQYVTTKSIHAELTCLFGHPVDYKTAQVHVDRVYTLAPNRHFLTVASTRAEKGVSQIIPNLLTYAWSCLVIDPKGENAWITAKRRRCAFAPHSVHILDPWGEVNRRYGDLAGEQETIARFNPLSILDSASPHYSDDLAYIADALIINQGKDPFFDDSARELLAGLISYCVEDDKETASLPLVRLLLSKPMSELAAIAEDAQRFGPRSLAARKLGRFIEDNKTNAAIVSTALTQTAFLDSSALSESLSTSDFSFDGLVSGFGETVYLVLPVDKLQTHGRWLRLMVSMGIRAVARNTMPLRSPVMFFLDEFGTIGRLSAVSQAYGLMAGLKMCIWAFVQDLHQLKKDYPDEWETFIGNSEAITFFGVMDHFTASYVSQMLGNTTIEEISEATGSKRRGLFGDPNYTSMQDRAFGRPLVTSDEVRGMSKEKVLMITRDGPLYFNKFRYYNTFPFCDMAREDPRFTKEPTREELEAAAKAATEKLEAAAKAAIPDYSGAVNFFENLGCGVKSFGWLFFKTYTIKSEEKSIFLGGKNGVIEAARRAWLKQKEQKEENPPSKGFHF